MKLFYALSICLLSAGASYAAPPPPEILPAKFPKEIEGYNIEDIYSNYTRNIEYAYPDALIERAKKVENFKGPHIIFHADWRRNSTMSQYVRDCEGECRWIHHTLTLDDDYFTEVASQSFDPVQMVDDLKQANISPADIWEYDFEVDRMVKQKLVEKISIRTLTQTQCPAILESLEVFEGLRLPKIDIEGVGKDRKGEGVIVHSVWIEIVIPLIERKSIHGGEMQILGYGPDSYAGQLVKKIFEPIKPCFDN